MRVLLQIMKKKLKLDEISATKKERKKERKKEGNKQTNKVTNTCRIHQGLREHLTTAPGKTAVRMVLADTQKIIILHILLK